METFLIIAIIAAVLVLIAFFTFRKSSAPITPELPLEPLRFDPPPARRSPDKRPTTPAQQPKTLREACSVRPGRWKTLYPDVDVRGEEYRLEDCMMFAMLLVENLKRGMAFGVDLEREPENEHDSHAIKVMGFWTNNEGRQNIHIGYIGRQMAYGIHKRIGDDTPITARLAEIETSDDELNIVIDVLIPADTEVRDRYDRSGRSR